MMRPAAAAGRTRISGDGTLKTVVLPMSADCRPGTLSLGFTRDSPTVSKDAFWALVGAKSPRHERD
jgi:hypothetical protein